MSVLRIKVYFKISARPRGKPIVAKTFAIVGYIRSGKARREVRGGGRSEEAWPQVRESGKGQIYVQEALLSCERKSEGAPGAGAISPKRAAGRL